MTFMFEKLEVYQRAVCLSESITRRTQNFPRRGYYHLVDQLRRASLSISLNIAEGNGRWHPKDRKNFFWIARGSVFECIPLTADLQIRRFDGFAKAELNSIYNGTICLDMRLRLVKRFSKELKDLLVYV
jgi:four helix bundle protein